MSDETLLPTLEGLIATFSMVGKQKTALTIREASDRIKLLEWQIAELKANTVPKFELGCKHPKASMSTDSMGIETCGFCGKYWD